MLRKDFFKEYISYALSFRNAPFVLFDTLSFQIHTNQYYVVHIFIKRLFVVGGVSVDYCHRFFQAQKVADILGSINRESFCLSCFHSVAGADWRFSVNKIKMPSSLELVFQVGRTERKPVTTAYCQVVVILGEKLKQGRGQQ